MLRCRGAHGCATDNKVVQPPDNVLPQLAVAMSQAHAHERPASCRTRCLKRSSVLSGFVALTEHCWILSRFSRRAVALDGISLQAHKLLGEGTLHSIHNDHLTFSDHLHQFNASQHSTGHIEGFETPHVVCDPFHRSAILRNDFVQILDLTHFNGHIAFSKNLIAASLSRWALSRKSMVCPSLSTARYLGIPTGQAPLFIRLLKYPTRMRGTLL